MAFRIVLTRLASSEIQESICFYESRRKGFGKEYLNYLKGYLSILKTNPELFEIKRKPVYRELPLKRFPFIIIYEIDKNEILVHSVFHTSRNPTKKA